LIALCTAGLAAAAPCYVIIDRNDAVIYRDLVPPIDLSTAGSGERAALRQRGQLLLIADFDHCNAVGYISPTTGSTTATVDEIVAGLRPAIGTSSGNSGGTVTSAAAGGIAAPRAAPAAQAAPARAPAPRSKY
jgi:hypothetical protein